MSSVLDYHTIGAFTRFFDASTKHASIRLSCAQKSTVARLSPALATSMQTVSTARHPPQGQHVGAKRGISVQAHPTLVLVSSLPTCSNFPTGLNSRLLNISHGWLELFELQSYTCDNDALID